MLQLAESNSPTVPRRALDDLVDEHRCLGVHRRAHGGGERRVDGGVLGGGADLVDAQPFAHHPHHPIVSRLRREQSPDLLLAPVRRRQAASDAGSGQRLIGRAAGHEIRQGARQLVAGQRHVPAARAVAELGDVQESHRLQDRARHQVDPFVVGAGAVGARVVEGQQIRQLRRRDGAPERLGAERVDERRRAGLPLRGRVRAGGERRELVVRARLRHQRLRCVVERLGQHRIDPLPVVQGVAADLARIGGKLVLGVWVVPSSACTEASYSAFVIRRMLGGSRGVPPGMLVHTPLLQLPLQGWLQPPQFWRSDVTSMQALPQSICPEPEQPQAPALQTDPPGQALPHAPQFSALFVTSTQAPFGHRVSPPAHTDWQELPLQTWPPLQLVEQPPQWVASGATQVPAQSRRPALHRQWPAWQALAGPAGAAARATVLLVGRQILAGGAALGLAAGTLHAAASACSGAGRSALPRQTGSDATSAACQEADKREKRPEHASSVRAEPCLRRQR